MSQLLLAVLVTGVATASAAKSTTCLSNGKGGTCKEAPELETGSYYWPMTRGPVGSSGTSPYAGPLNVSKSLAWSWTPSSPTLCVGGALIDGSKNLYVQWYEGIRKFSPDGQVLWSNLDIKTSDVPAIMDGGVFANSRDGEVVKLSMEDGHLVWKTKIGDSEGGDIGSIGAYKGIILTNSDGVGFDGGNRRVTALNATDGKFMWDFHSEHQLWNFLPVYTDTNSFVFQDQIGTAYHMTLDGKLLWKAGYLDAGFNATWTDGGTMLGPNGVVYTVHADAPLSGLHPLETGNLIAYRLSDGKQLWKHEFPYPPNSWPVVGRMQEDGDLLVIMPIGAQPAIPGQYIIGATSVIVGAVSLTIGLIIWAIFRLCICRCSVINVLFCVIALTAIACWKVMNAPKIPPVVWATGFPSDVLAFNAETGKLQWHWAPPVWWHRAVAGDMEGFFPRIRAGVQPVCIPNPWGSPSLDANGIIYLAHLNGNVYTIADLNNDSDIDPATEVSSYATPSAFGHPGASLAPGMMAMVSCDTLYVFKDQ